MDEYFQEMEEKLQDNISVFSNKQRPKRDRWILNQWIGSTSPQWKDKAIKQGERPDFHVDTVPVEVTEVLTPGCRRHDQYRKDLKQIKQKQVPDHAYNRLAYNAQQGPSWIVQAIENKMRRYSSDDIADWVLVVYANFHGACDVYWDKVRESLSRMAPAFQQIDVLYAWRNSHKTATLWKRS